MPDKDDGCCAWPVPGLDICSSDEKPKGRSRDEGRRIPRRVSTSVDLERNKLPFGVFGSDPAGLCLLLNVRRIEATLLSPSLFALSLLNPKPNRFLNEELFELTEPLFVFEGFVRSHVSVPSTDEPLGMNSSNRLSNSSTSLSRSET